MSSLLQHDGEIRGNRVVLKMYLVKKEKDPASGILREEDAETALCLSCHRPHAVLYKVARRPVGMLGCWVQFRWNGEVHAPDLSIPIRVERLPRDAERMAPAEAAAYWHSP